LENLNPKTLNKPAGILFLPNHPTAFIDPVVVTLGLMDKFPVRPMVIEYMYYNPLFNIFLRLVNAVPVPDFTDGNNSLKRKKNDKMMQSLVADLKNGDNFLIYPAGSLKQTALEEIGANSAVHKLVQDVPEANVVLVRIKGLWGSSFSRAFTGKTPSIAHVIWNGIKTVFKNFIFFTPKRSIVVEFVPAPADFPYKASRLEFNRYLERWYNQPDGLSDQKAGDSLVLVSYSAFKNEVLELYKPKAVKEEKIKLDLIPQKVKEKVVAEIARIGCIDAGKITPELDLATDLGLDSLDVAELHAFLHHQFEVSGVPAYELTTVGKTFAIAAKQITFKENGEEPFTVNLKKWFEAGPKTRCQLAEGETIPEVFLNSCQRMGSKAACGDLRSGVLTYSQLKMRALLLADYIRTLPGDYIGILLPSSVPAYVCVLACQLAGKIPLMVNWTIGPRHLESVVKLSNVQAVLTSWAFVDRLDNVDFNGIDERMVMLEDVRASFGLFKKLKSLYWSKRSTKAILNHYPQKTKEDTAVLLFTSGTESMPKGVPLSHRNLISNQTDALSLVEITSDDIMYGFLPPFHSFGLSYGGLLGLLAGIRICFSPDPTNGKQLIENIEKWGVTAFCSAPTFVKNMLKSAKKEQLAKIRLCLTGAEKTPPELISMMESFGKKGCLFEGYGITECGPVLTLNVPGEPIVGVGKPFPSVQIRVVDQETYAPIPLGEQGMIIAKGPNIFSGYLNGLKSPFIELEGSQWYITGDLGFLDQENHLTISGRKKRFIKIGGEMISLAAIENVVFDLAHNKNWLSDTEGPAVAVSAKEEAGEKTKIYLFTKFHTTAEEVNHLLKLSGFSNLVRISSVIELNEIPIMGTGKINYRLLEAEHCTV
jgi:acyl-CoA synthetase (AMP-forming)/AMP-acid ligase II/1-acyl-sn-glycerol-3-phosphate acyltransferase/acyl carrier protein